MEKKGFSTVIVTIILVALALISLGVVWGVISNVITRSSEDISIEKITIDAEVRGVNVNESSNNLVLLVRRKPGAGNLVGFKFVFKNQSDGEIITKNTTMKELEEEYFMLHLKMNVSEVITATLVPLTKTGEKTLYGSILFVYNLQSGRYISLPPGMGAACGNDVIEGSEVCDGIDLGGNDCITLGMGFTGGILGCYAPTDPSNCTYDTSQCTTTPKCSDGMDNDLDGCWDYPDDTGCLDANDEDESGGTCPQCSDLMDNDLDGAIDYPDDFSCSSISDNDEILPKAECQDTIDNDLDTFVDLDDPDCTSSQDNSEV